MLPVLCSAGAEGAADIVESSSDAPSASSGMAGNLVSAIRSFLPGGKAPEPQLAGGKKPVKASTADVNFGTQHQDFRLHAYQSLHEGVLCAIILPSSCLCPILASGQQHSGALLQQRYTQEHIVLQVKALEAADAARRKEAARNADRIKQKGTLDKQRAERAKVTGPVDNLCSHPG